MINFLKYFYYRIYIWDLKRWGEETNSPQYKSVLGVVFFIFLNILTLVFLIISLAGVSSLPKLTFLGKAITILFVSILFLCGYFVFLNKKKYEKIIIKYKDETKLRKKQGLLKIFLYMFLSFFLFIAVCIAHNILK